MSKTPFAIKILPEVKERLQAFCEERGIKQGYFVEKAILEKLEREETFEDALEFKRWKHEEPQAVPFEDYLKQRTSRMKKSA